MSQIKDFILDGKNYYKKEEFQGGWQWACRYPDGQESWVAIWTKEQTRQQVIDAIDDVNYRSTEAYKEEQEYGVTWR
jgi:hypothetical protein